MHLGNEKDNIQTMNEITTEQIKEAVDTIYDSISLKDAFGKLSKSFGLGPGIVKRWYYGQSPVPRWHRTAMVRFIARAEKKRENSA